MRWLLALLCFAGSLLLPLSARADLDQDATKLVREWKKLGKVQRLPVRMLERGQSRPLLLAPSLSDPTSEDCVTVAVLGAKSSTFLLRFAAGDTPLHWPEGEYPEQSVAGAAQLVRCGVRKLMLERLLVEMRSPRALLEFVVVRAPRPVPPLMQALTQRNAGPGAPLGVSGPRPAPAPLEARVRAIEARTRRLGANEQTRRSYRIGRDGASASDLQVEAGCHRVDVLGPGINLDAEIAWLEPPEMADMEPNGEQRRDAELLQR